MMQIIHIFPLFVCVFLSFIQLKRYKTYVNILSAPVNGDGQNNFQNSCSDEANILNLQSHSVNESNVNYYHHSTNRTTTATTKPTPQYRSTTNTNTTTTTTAAVGAADESSKYEVANF